MENKLPTAEEFLDCKSSDYDYFDKELELITTKMKEFAKLHVQEALKQASEKAITIYIEPDGCATGDYYDVDKDSILNAYNLDDIK